jgi:uncharacterized protein
MPPPPAPEASRAIAEKIAEEIGCRPQQVLATASLLDEGATVPFVARYRKEVTGGLDDIQLRLLDERLSYLREMEDRRSSILASIEEQGKLTPELAAGIHAADTKQRLEDLYLPYKPKRRSKAQIAREAGLARSPKPCWPTPGCRRKWKPGAISIPKPASPTSRACSTAPARS